MTKIGFLSYAMIIAFPMVSNPNSIRWSPRKLTVPGLPISQFPMETNFHHPKRTVISILPLGDEGSGDGQFDYTRGVAVAPDGSIYVVDDGNHRIQKFSVGQ